MAGKTLPFPVDLKDWRGVPIVPGSLVIYTRGKTMGEGTIEGTYFKSGMVRVTVNRSKPTSSDKTVGVYPKDVVVIDAIPDSPLLTREQRKKNQDSHLYQAPPSIYSSSSVYVRSETKCIACFLPYSKSKEKACGV